MDPQNDGSESTVHEWWVSVFHCAVFIHGCWLSTSSLLRVCVWRDVRSQSCGGAKKEVGQ